MLLLKMPLFVFDRDLNRNVRPPLPADVRVQSKLKNVLISDESFNAGVESPKPLHLLMTAKVCNHQIVAHA